MKGYIVIRIQAESPSQLKDYQAIAPSTIEKFNGKFIARGGEVISLEGPKEKRRVVIIEFPTLNDANNFYNSDEYQAAIKLRENVANAEIIAIEGVN